MYGEDLNLSPDAAALVATIENEQSQYPDSEVCDIPDDGDYDHRLVQQTILNAQVCTRLTPQEAADWLTVVRPPHTRHNRWVVDVESGEVECEQFPDTHRHVLVDC